MFSNLTKVSYTNYFCTSALDLHGPAFQSGPNWAYAIAMESRHGKKITVIHKKVQMYLVLSLMKIHYPKCTFDHIINSIRL